MMKYLESNRTIRNIETAVLVILLGVSLASFVMGTGKINGDPGDISYQGSVILSRDESLEDYDEDSTVCDVVYTDGDRKLIVSYPYEEYVDLDRQQIEAQEYVCDDGTFLLFEGKDPSFEQIKKAYRSLYAEKMMPVFNLANALLILCISLMVVLFCSEFFTTYEKVWFMTIMTLATIVAVIFPEESANGVNGIVIMLLYLLDTFLNILCELLISKQSRYNFLVSVLVEITEIVICLVLMYRFATMAVTLFFWLPIDIISFINWSRHKDDEQDELTVVRRLKGYQEVLVIAAIIVWTAVVGYFLSGLDISSDFLSPDISLAVTYIDACASAVGVANGLFILFRMRE
ncbi:MAG: nicotinamide mononucleotide transporter, partial [Erysipelotrichaceae bacterium]|nr:nicotinamide mononucleotide transporter [Erysipelotrichaceae bacterium]